MGDLPTGLRVEAAGARLAICREQRTGDALLRPGAEISLPWPDPTPRMRTFTPVPRRMTTEASIRRRITRKVGYGAKVALRWTGVLLNGKPVSSPVFVFGMQRSGTRLVLDVMGRSPEIATYYENHPDFYCGVLLRDNRTVARRIQDSPFRLVALKPICESHRARELLDLYPTGKGIWIFRHFRDSVNSAAAKWSTARQHLRSLAEGDFREAGWRAGGLTPELLERIRGVYREDLSEHAAQAVMWYLRNCLFFEQRLAEHERIRLVSYEALVQHPKPAFREMFAFLGVDFAPKYVCNVYASSVNARPFPPIPQDIADLCTALEGRLLETHGSAESVVPV